MISYSWYRCPAPNLSTHTWLAVASQLYLNSSTLSSKTMECVSKWNNDSLFSIMNWLTVATNSTTSSTQFGEHLQWSPRWISQSRLFQSSIATMSCWAMIHCASTKQRSNVKPQKILCCCCWICCCCCCPVSSLAKKCLCELRRNRGQCRSHV